MKKRKAFLLAGGLCLLICVVCIVALILGNVLDKPPELEGARSDISPAFSQDSSSDESVVGDSSSDDNSTADSSSSETSSEAEPYVSPVDFDALHAQCEDIYAWLWIPGTDEYPGRDSPVQAIDYPVVQDPDDDSFYLDHGVDGKSDRNGTLYTEHRYNGLDFSDPVTVIYGHNMKSGLMFGYLQEQFSNSAWFSEHLDMYIYLPERTLRYRVFAAVPYGTEHILYKYGNFQDRSSVTEFLETVYHVNRFGKNYNEDCTVTENDRILVLSTCLPRSADGRYLVLGKLEEVIGEPLP